MHNKLDEHHITLSRNNSHSLKKHSIELDAVIVLDTKHEFA